MNICEFGSENVTENWKIRYFYHLNNDIVETNHHTGMYNISNCSKLAVLQDWCKLLTHKCERLLSYGLKTLNFGSHFEFSAIFFYSLMQFEWGFFHHYTSVEEQKIYKFGWY